tara:strand:+ start:11434 stop:11721 length:288 start_codon:yes stop_codon:yes gene_type:complete
MKSILSKFCGIFPTIVFDIEEKPIKAKLSTPTISTGERQILKMLADAKKNLSKFKKLHKQGKASIDDVFDWDWRVHELELELMKFQDSTSIDDEY